MEKDNTYEAYLKSFNQGYIIQKHMPELGDEIAKALKEDTLWADGFKEGREQLLKDVETEKSRPKYLQKDRLNAFKENRGPSKEKDKGDVEREKE